MASRRETDALSARISVEDDASRPLDRITRSVQRNQNEIIRLRTQMGRLREQTNRRMNVNVNTRQAEANVSRLDRAFRGFERTLNAVGKISSTLGSKLSKIMPSGGMMSLGGLAGAIGGGYAAKKVFDSTFLNAANYELSAKTIQAMFNDRKKSDTYMKQMEQMALASPLLNSGQIFQSSGMFVSMTKDLDQLNSIWRLVEKLTSRNPNEALGGGVFGASYALSSALSGDLVSLKDRFNMNTKELNGIKDLKLKDQIKLLEKYFAKLGMTDTLIQEVGDTTIGVWNQIKETTDVSLRKIGEPAVKIVKPFLDDINKAMQEGKQNRFVKFGQEMFSGIASGFVNSSRGIGKYIDGIINDPAFQKAKNVEGKVSFVIEDLYERFNGWFEKAGKAQVESAVTSIASTISTLILNNSDKVAGAALQMGAAVGSSIASGIAQAIDNSPLAKAIIGAVLGGIVGGPVGALVGAGAATGMHYADKFVEWVTPWDESARNKPDLRPKNNKNTTKTTPKSNNKALNQIHNKKAFGLSRVPKNDYPVLLHEGERVLTKQQANQSDKGSNNSPVQINIQNMQVREEADIHKIAREFVFELEKQRVSYGGAWD